MVAGFRNPHPVWAVARPASNLTEHYIATMTAAIAFFELLDEERIKALLLEPNQEHSDADKHRLLCAACSHPITAVKHQIARDGAHRHEFTNPYGRAYCIGCFDAAPGCAQIGPASAEWTWFRGFEWRIAICRQCGTHLGWGFQSTAGEGFFGLILDRLVLAH